MQRYEIDDSYDIVKTKVHKDITEINATIETVANGSIISRDVAEKLNLPIRLNKKNKLQLEDEHCLAA